MIEPLALALERQRMQASGKNLGGLARYFHRLI